jgi:hypothetical protein
MSEAATETPPETPPESWLDSIPEGMREAPFIKGADSLEVALGNIENAAQYMGNSIRIPGEEAGDEDRQAFITKVMEKAPQLMLKPDLNDETQAADFYKMLGRPETAEDYKYDPGEGNDVPENIKAFAEIAFNNGLNQAQFQKMVSSIMEGEAAQMEQTDEAQIADLRNLHAEWGMKFDENVRIIGNFLKLTDGPEVLQDMLKEGQMSTSEMKWLHNIASQTKSAVELAQQPAGTVTVLTPDMAQASIQEMLNNQKHPYWNPADPGHKKAVERMVELQQMANPGATREF